MVESSADRFNGYVASLAIKAPCVIETSSNITLSGEQTINGVDVVSGDRVLVKDQTNAVENGVWVVDTSAWSRAPDFDGNRDIAKGSLVLVSRGVSSVTVLYAVTSNNPLVIGTSAINFSLFSSSGSYPENYIENYGGVADGVTDSTTAMELAADNGRLAIKFYEAGLTDVLSTYTPPHNFYILRDAFVDSNNITGPANFTSDGTQVESVLRLGRAADYLNGTQWRFRSVSDITFSGKLRVDNGISFGADNNYPNTFALGWEIRNCLFERCNIGIKKEHGNFGNRITNCSSTNGNFGYWAQAYPIRTEIGALGEASGQTVLTVLDTNGMNALDFVRILMDDASIHESTIASVDSPTQITINDAIDDDAAAGNYVKAYHPDDAVPSTLAHPGNDTISHGEWSGHRKAAFYIDGQNAPGCGNTIFRDVIVENNPGFGIFIKDYNNAFTPIRLENVWFESNATDTAVDLGDGFGNRVSQDIYFENVDNAIVVGSRIQKATFIDSVVSLDNCTFTASSTVLTVTNTNNKNTLEITNLHIDGWGDEVSGASDVVVKSIKVNDREGGDGVARCWRAPDRIPTRGHEVSGGIVKETDTGNSGEDWLGVDADPDVSRDGYVEGLTYPDASQYTFLASDDYLAPAVLATPDTTAGKAYVMTMEIKVDSGLANIGSIKWGGAYNFTRGDSESLLTQGEWSTIAFVGQLGAGNSGAIRPQITMGSGGNAQITIGASQIIEFDDVQDAYDFYNRGIHIWQARPSLRVKKADTSISTDTTLTDDPDLSDWNLIPDTNYRVEGFLMVDTNAAADLKFGFNFSETVQYRWIDYSYISSALVRSVIEDSTAAEVMQGETADQSLIIDGMFKTNASTGGTTSFEWAQQISDAYSTTIKEGSWIKITKAVDED